ncbi:MAG: hypothetical protein WC474_13280 [Hydrogenophilaceae bacterium]
MVAIVSATVILMAIAISSVTTVVTMIPAIPIAIIMASVRHDITTTQTHHHQASKQQ